MTKPDPSPTEAAARDAAQQHGLNARSLTTLHDHATSVFLLPEENLVLRVAPKSRSMGMTRAVTLVRWLAEQGLPVPKAADVPQPLLAAEHIVTIWEYYPQPAGTRTPGTEHLGALLRKLHSLPAPPLELPAWQPLSSLRETLNSSTSLPPGQTEWLSGRIQELLTQYEQLEFPLSEGMLHGDAYPGNCIWDKSRVLLGDWDEASTGPREIDLANTFQGVRFGRTQDELKAFSDSYGYDITTWTGLPVLTQIRDMHTLGSYIKRADRNDPTALQELENRIRAIQQGDTRTPWRTS
ncbi:phosphotransferase enzyme family protein [Streptomyces sp. NPDC015350]|uniref:phosphotransferase enzyme family protein n=1 Tax=Streptomyces sp. NPDC015350 TaxID=3364955 RepID=UPI0036F831E1